MNNTTVADMTRGRKTISISDETYGELAKLGDLSETFDDVIKRLIKEHKSKKS